MSQLSWKPDQAGNYWGSVIRNDEAGLIFLTGDGQFDFFATVKTEKEIPKAIQEGMKLALKDDLNNPQVFTNGRLTGPAINFGVRERM